MDEELYTLRMVEANINALIKKLEHDIQALENIANHLDEQDSIRVHRRIKELRKTCQQESLEAAKRCEKRLSKIK